MSRGAKLNFDRKQYGTPLHKRRLARDEISYEKAYFRHQKKFNKKRTNAKTSILRTRKITYRLQVRCRRRSHFYCGFFSAFQASNTRRPSEVNAHGLRLSFYCPGLRVIAIALVGRYEVRYKCCVIIM